MLLQALVELAENEKLIADPDLEFKPVAWLLRLRDDGTLITIESRRDNLNEGVLKKGKPVKPKWVGRKTLVPIQPVRTANDAECFAVDKTEYVLGVDPAGKRNPDKLLERLNLFYAAIGRCASVVDSAAATAVMQFGQWLAGQPLAIRTALVPQGLEPGDLFMFAVGSDPTPLHNHAAVRAYWKALRTPAAEAEEGDASQPVRRCLITLGPVKDVQLFRKVKNVPGDAGGGLSLVSFNADAWKSYGWAGGDNAPVSRTAAEAAVTALSRLLDPRPVDGDGATLPVRRIRLAEDTGVVFWSPKAKPEVQGVLDAIPDLLDPAEDVADVGNLLSSVRTGAFRPLSEPAAFYAMTLTSVTGRVVVRDWMESTVADVQRNLRAHFEALACVRNTRPAAGRPLRGVLSLGELLDSLAPPGRERKIPAVLAAGLVHAALRGGPYPDGLIQRALLRARAEAGADEWADEVRRDARAAILKAVLNRRRLHDADAPSRYSEVLIHMDPTNTDPGYNCGALIAVLERLQAAALGDVNASIIDKYFSSASAMPRLVFDRLLKNARHHARKAMDDGKVARQAFSLERLIDEIVSRFQPARSESDDGDRLPKRRLPQPSGIPMSLNLEQQSLFVIGYHHARRYLWMTAEERDAWEAERPDAPRAFLRWSKGPSVQPLAATT